MYDDDDIDPPESIAPLTGKIPEDGSCYIRPEHATRKVREQASNIISLLNNHTLADKFTADLKQQVAECLPNALTTVDAQGKTALDHCLSHSIYLHDNQSRLKEVEDLCLIMLEKAPVFTAKDTTDIRVRTNQVTPVKRLEHALKAGFDNVAVKLLEGRFGHFDEHLLESALPNKCSRYIERVVDLHHDELTPARWIALARHGQVGPVIKYQSALSAEKLATACIAAQKNGTATAEPLYALLDKRTGLTSTAKLEFIQQLCTTTDIVDMLDDVVGRLLIPAYALLQTPPNRPPQQLVTELPQQLHATLREKLIYRLFLPLMQQKHMNLGSIMRHFAQLSDSWHRVTFPALDYEVPQGVDLPKNTERRWHPLLPEPFTLSHNGKQFTFRSLETQTELKDESKKHGHCVYSYGNNCSREKEPSHIVAMRSADGELASTVEFRLVGPNDSLNFTPLAEVAVPKSDLKLVVIQHQGKNGGTLEHISSGTLHQVLQAFMEKVKDGKVAINTLQQGETEESRKASSLAPLIRSCGYWPTWKNVDLVFNEFKKDRRRGSTGVEEQPPHHLIYAWPPVQLIDGKVPVSQGSKEILDTRDMNAREWLHAILLLEVMQDLAYQTVGTNSEARKILEEMKAMHASPLTATMPAPEPPIDIVRFDQQHDPAFAEGWNHGTLDGKTIGQLPEAERRKYLGRVKEANRKPASPYLDGSTGKERFC